MPIERGTLEQIATELGLAFEPLAERLREGEVLLLLQELGLHLHEDLITPSLQTAVQAGADAAVELPNLIASLTTAIESGTESDVVAAALPLARQSVVLIDSFITIANEIQILGSAPGLSATEFQEFVVDLPGRLVEKVLLEYLATFRPLLLAVLELFGLAERMIVNPGSTDHLRPEFTLRRLHLERLVGWLQNPEQVLRDTYGWGEPTIQAGLLFDRLQPLLRALAIPVTRGTFDNTSRPTLEIFVFTLVPTEGITPQGLEAWLRLAMADGFSQTFPLSSGWEFELGVSGALAASVAARILPPADLALVPPSGSVQGQLAAGIARVPDEGSPSFILIGLPGGSRLEASRLSLRLLGEFRWDTSQNQAVGDFGFEGRVEAGKLVITLEEADGFIGEIMAGVRLEADFDMGFGWRAGGGFFFEGSSALEVQLPAHISLGPIQIDALTLGIGIEDRSFPVSLSGNIRAELGPLVAVVEQIGFRIPISFPESNQGNAGPVQIDFEFQPPRGIGLSVDAGVIVGGGYLMIDVEKGEYAGALELTFSGFISLKAVGIITTKMPDGSDGFSLLIIITAEFGTGFQLGFGFTLLGVGGLLGLNRTMLLEPLAEGVRSGSVDNILFPQDVIANITRIISDLRTFFPPENGKFLIGPMAKIGWGTPTLVSLSLGIIIEIPGNIAILGVLRLALPTAEEALIVLQVSFIGAIEFDKKRVWFFATLFESRVLFITLDGEMGLLMAFGEDANFVLSVGGFHPSFSPPPLPFPSPRRIALSILNESYARIRVEGYFAVTSNTAQFGASAELFFGVDAASVEGHIAFDALFRFSPFYFIIEISASVSIKVFGMGLFSIRLRFSLEGTSPWRAHGTGSIGFLFFEISADFDITWGEEKDTKLPPIAVMPLIEGEYVKNDSWQAVLPASNTLLVSLRALDTTPDMLVLHPLGTLKVTQKSVPLTLTLDKIGSQAPSDVNRLTLTIASGGLTRRADATELFAIAQFQSLDDAAKLSRPAYQHEPSGMELGAGEQNLATSQGVRRSVRYELITIDTNFKRFVRRFFLFDALLFQHFMLGAAVSLSTISRAERQRKNPFVDSVKVQEASYTVAFQATNKAFHTESSFASEASAQEYLRQQTALHPELEDSLHVIAHHEVAA